MRVFRASIFLNSKNARKFLNIQAWNQISLKSLQESQLYKIFIANGGIKHFPKYLISYAKELIWVGDLDSATKYLFKLKQINKKIFLQLDKDISDYGAILQYIQKNEAKHYDSFFIEVIGGIGGDFAHEFANIFESSFFIKRVNKPIIFVFHNKYLLFNSIVELKLNIGQYFSIFSLNQSNLKIKIKGAKYNGNLIISRPSHGLHNICMQNRVQLIPKGPGLVII